MVCRYSVESTLEINNRGVSRKRRKQGCVDSNHTSDDNCLEPTTNKRLKRAKIQLLEESTSFPSETNDSSKKAYGVADSTPVIAPINMKKGEPRSTLFEPCKKLLWPMPSFTVIEHKSKTPMVIGQGEERKKGFYQLCVKNHLEGTKSCRY